MLLSLSELNDLLSNCIIDAPLYVTDCQLFMQVLQVTGCRPMELFDSSLWSVVSGSTVSLQPLKHNATRSFQLASLPSKFGEWLVASHPLFPLSTYRNQSFAWKKVVKLYPVMCLGKACDLYLYRHAFIKNLAADGKTIREIMAITGHRSPSIVSGYVNSVLYYE